MFADVKSLVSASGKERTLVGLSLPRKRELLLKLAQEDESVEVRARSWEALIDARQTTYGLNGYFAPNQQPLFG